MWVVECLDMLPSIDGRPLCLDVDVVFCGEVNGALLIGIGVSEVVRPSRLVEES
jgi:hypothetical protein